MANFFLPYGVAIQLTPFIQYNSSLMGCFIVAICCLLQPIFKNKSYLLWLICIIAIIFLQSRLGLLCAGFAIGTNFFLLKKFHTKIHYALVSICIIASIAFSFIKANSTIGRSFILQNVFDIIIKQKNGSFRSLYNQQQYQWFIQNGVHNKQAFVAGNTYYAFNEWLQFIIEYGWLPTILLLCSIIFVVILFYTSNKKNNILYQNLVFTQALLVLLLGSLCSYPFYFLPTLFLFTVILSYMAYSIVTYKYKSLKVYTILILFIGSCYFLLLATKQFVARLHWQTASELTVNGYYKKSELQYKQANKTLYNNADFLLDYATCLYNIKNYTAACTLLNKAKNLSNSYMVNRLLGNIYVEQQNYQLAEQYYLESYYTIPNKFVSAFYVMNFYKQTNNKSKAIFWANHILKMPIKLNSPQVKNVRNQANALVKQ